MPFILIGNAISNILSENKIKHQVIHNLENDMLNENDLLILFQPTFSGGSTNKCPNIRCKMIYINSEAIHSRNIEEQIDHDNILEVWDYSYKNIDNLKKIKSNIHYVPITYHYNFETVYNKSISKRQISFIKTFDFLIFGSINERRQVIINKLKDLKYNVAVGLTGNSDELIELIERSKIIIDIHHYPHDLPIDFYRLYFLISNKVFVIHETPEKVEFNKDFDKLIFSDYDNFTDNCVKYINMSQELRDQISYDQYNWWKNKHPFKNKIPLKTLLKYNTR